MGGGQRGVAGGRAVQQQAATRKPRARTSLGPRRLPVATMNACRWSSACGTRHRAVALSSMAMGVSEEKQV